MYFARCRLICPKFVNKEKGATWLIVHIIFISPQIGILFLLIVVLSLRLPLRRQEVPLPRRRRG